MIPEHKADPHTTLPNSTLLVDPKSPADALTAFTTAMFGTDSVVPKHTNEMLPS